LVLFVFGIVVVVAVDVIYRWCSSVVGVVVGVAVDVVDDDGVDGVVIGGVIIVFVVIDDVGCVIVHVDDVDVGVIVVDCVVIRVVGVAVALDVVIYVGGVCFTYDKWSIVDDIAVGYGVVGMVL